MKMFGTQRKTYGNGYKSKFYFLFVPIVKKIRDDKTRRIYLFGIKVYHKNFFQQQVVNNQIVNNQITQTIIDDSARFITEILNKALEKNLREMKLFEAETKERLAKIEKKLK